ncbi:baseplate J/gp47 family protein [Paludibacterium paludis]|uniref:Baseplate protein J-like domain-containing protein n=1 Tax=Paludibacterium paludis TaxID=1225769 RepID=A0A918P2F8_9NEIS|nr:baseplate J/gp47 family protein [Paludibacterium paludis]GGY13860.1 hypothetical protein GCM10011289_16520 [Paludibacterium paludis]
MRHGTEQQQRLPDALRPGYVLPDEWSLAQRTRLTLLDAAGLPFDENTWDTVLRRDEAFVLADLAAFPAGAWLQAFLDRLDWDDETRLWQDARDLIARCDDWCRRLGDAASPAAREIGRSLRYRIEQKAAVPVGECLRLCDHGPSRLRPVWERRDGVAAQGGEMAEETARRQWLRRGAMALTQTIAAQQDAAHEAFRASLHSGRHDPAMGLLLAALQLAQDSRAVINRIPDRLVDFYYRDVLRLSARPSRAERVHLLLRRSPRHPGTLRIEAGARFSGGKDAGGRPAVVTADHALEAGDTQVAALCALRAERDPAISPEREFGYATRIKVETLPLQAPETVNVPAAPWWPLLGGQARGSASRAADAVFGLAIASPLLQLKEGRREVRLRLRLSHPSDDDAALRQLLRVNPARRGADWLAAAYARYARHETLHAPPRSRPGPPPAALDPDVMARASWQRSERFGTDVWLAFLIESCLACQDTDRFAERLGRLFAVWLAAGGETLRQPDLAALRRHAARLPGAGAAADVQLDDPLSLIFAPHGNDALSPDRELIFQRVFSGVWDARLSTAQGWLTLDRVFMARPRGQEANEIRGALDISLRLDPSEPPIDACGAQTHGAHWPARPVLQLNLSTRTPLYAYSLLRQYRLQELNLEVAVEGLRDIVLYNPSGRLDPSKPFQPFGPLPALGSYIVLGGRELIGKSLSALRLRLAWAGLPSGPDGFAGHYANYPGSGHAGAFRVNARVLADGQWRTAPGDGLPLFGADRHGRRPLSRQVLEFPVETLLNDQRAVAPPPAGQPFGFGLDSRNGFFRFELISPSGAFGHAEYPSLLTAALTLNARRKRPGPVPREPYTPTLESLTLDYRATQDIPLTADTAQGSAVRDPDSLAHTVYHLHPFGLPGIAASGAGRHPPLLPAVAHDGQLYIGLDGDDPQGALSLYFHLRKEVAAERWLDTAPRLHWSVWRAGVWHELAPHDQLADGTRGLRRSGIIVLDLPPGMSRGCTALPGDHYWLRLGADWGFEQLAGLHGVHAHAVTATRVGTACDPLAAGVIATPEQGIPGLAGVLQAGPSEGRRRQETSEDLRTRAAERLRHKRRAQTPWDYERLLLEAFPGVFKVKCFAHHLPTLGDESGLGSRRPDRAPGQTLVVVVPDPRNGEPPDHTAAPGFDAATLDEMQDFLEHRAAAGAAIVVRNAAYERVQVRATLRLEKGRHHGSMLRDLNRLLLDYLSPWYPGGPGAQFGWCLRAETLESLLRAHPGVAQVGRAAMLHIVRNDRHYHALQGDTTGPARRELHPAQPWSLLLPAARHTLILADEDTALPTPPTGIGQLEIGSTFIIGRPSPASTGSPAP